MSSGWPLTKLGDVLQPTRRGEPVDPLREYRLLGVRLDGHGPFLRETVLGSATSAGRLFRVAVGDFIYSRLFAWRGAFGVVSGDLDGCYVSGEFLAYEPNADRLDVQFLRLWFRLPGTLDRVADDCSGSTPLTRNRFKEQFLLSLEMPLPPLAEQQRIVARIEAVAEKVEEAGTLREVATKEAQALWANCLRARISGATGQDVPLENVCEAIIDNLHSNPRYTETGVPCVRSPDVGWGSLDLKGALRTDEEEYGRRTVRGEPREDDVVLVREGGGTGKAALVLPGNRFSLGQRVMMLRPDKTKVVPKFFLYQLLSPRVQEDQIRPLSKGSASPHLNIGALKTFTLRLPTLAVQQTVVDDLNGLRVNMQQLASQQEQIRAELDALLPAVLDRAFKGEL